MNEQLVYERVLAEQDRPMPLVDLEDVRARLLELPWVEDARVSRQLPDTLKVDIVERVPHAVLPTGPVRSRMAATLWFFCEAELNITRELPSRRDEAQPALTAM